MKKYLFLLLALFSITANAAFIGQNVSSNNIYYVTTTGNDTTGNGTASAPWLTLAKACTTVQTSGSTIKVGAGIFIETSQCVLAPKVSIEGVSQAATIIKAGYAGDKVIYANSTIQGTDGNQSISKLKFDGNSLTGLIAIYVQGRSNVKIYDSTFLNWTDNAVIMNGRGDNTYDFAPKIYAIGNEFYNNTVTNCDRYSGSGTGAFSYGGQDGIRIYNNTITSSRGTSAQTGWPIKYYSGGYSKNDKIYNNTLTRADPDGTGGFPFLIETWHGQGGTEVYGNTMLGGGIDINLYDKGTADYSIDFHNNLVGYNALWIGGGIPFGFQTEYTTSDAVVRNNYFYNLGTSGRAISIYVPAEANQQYNNYKIYNNIIVDSKVIEFGTTNISTRFDNWLIANNTAYRKSAGVQAIKLPPYGKVTNIVVRNNIISGFTTSAVEYEGASSSFMDNVSIENNLFYNNGNSNLFKNSGVNVPTNVIERGTVTTDPLFVNTTLSPPDLRIPVGSPARNIGLDVGINADYRGLTRINTPDAGALEYDERSARVNIAQP